MNHIKYVVALFALFMVMMPAFSMPDDGQMTGSDGQHQGIKSMMGDGGVKIVCLTVCKVIGPDGQHHMGSIKSMMGGKSQCSKDKSCGCEKSMMGQDGQNQKSCGCEKSMMGQDGQNQKSCGCEKSMMGQDGQNQKSCGCEKSMMGQDGQNQKSCGCEKSMMGQNGQNQKHHSQHHHSDDSDSSHNHSDDSDSE